MKANNKEESLKDLREKEYERFIKELDSSAFMQVSPCFMTGRACVYSEKIEENKPQKGGKEKYNGFIIMPFRPNISLYHNNCLIPFVKSNYSILNEKGETIKGLVIETANKVRRPGVIICEGICKKIQESDFIIADLSLPNSNVYYELGLAHGLNQKIIVIYKSDIEKDYKEDLMRTLDGLGCDKNKRFEYENLTPLTLDQMLERGKLLKLSDQIWQRDSSSDSIKPVTNWKKHSSDSEPGLIVFYSNDSDYLEKKSKENFKKNRKEDVNRDHKDCKEEDVDEDIIFEFKEHVPSAIGISISEIHSSLKENEIYKEIESKIELLKTSKVIGKEDYIGTIRKLIDECYCFVVRTGGENCNPLAYFWLGYCHAIGKNVIPITCIDNSKSRVDDLAFDIRAHRHITFIKERPELFTDEIKETLRLMIESDFRDLYRKRFWNGIIGKGGEISIFTGALHSDAHNREMIGDWDLLSVSELTSYFGRNQLRFKIEAPVYPPETAYLNKDEGSNSFKKKQNYICRLREKLQNKNCIIIASPDVNPLAEIVFGELFGLKNDNDYFNSHEILKKGNIRKSVWLAYKSIEKSKEKDLKRTFYFEELIKNGEKPKSGLKWSSKLDDEDFIREKPSVEPDISIQEPHVFGHLLVAKNPFIDGQEKKYIIVLNGVGGPATFALTHALTGGVITEFTDYNVEITNTAQSKQKFNPETSSEGILEKFSEIFDTNGFNFMDSIAKVYIKKFQSTSSTEVKNKNDDLRIGDWRKISGWELIKSFEGEFTRIDSETKK